MTPLTPDRIISDLARATDRPETTLDLSVPLTDQGLDSLRLVTLTETWRAEGHDIDFFDLMGLSTGQQWINHLTHPA